MTHIQVLYQGEQVGTCVRNPNGSGTLFYYEDDFADRGMELSPLQLPTSIRGPVLKTANATKSLPGLLYDSLPDSFGSQMMNSWFLKRELAAPGIFQQLAYVGQNGPGALTFTPLMDSDQDSDDPTLEQLDEATKTYQQELAVDTLDECIRVTTSTGGAQRKVMVFYDPKKDTIHSKVKNEADYDALLVKFPDELRLSHPETEHAYCLLASVCGIRTQKSRLLTARSKNGAYKCFAASRYDREKGKRIHYHSYRGVVEGRYGERNIPDYSHLMETTLELTRDYREVLEVYRRAIFNVLVDNTDDHSKNHGFLFDGKDWKLSPAFDLTFRDSSGAPERGLNVLGRSNMFSRSLFRRLADTHGLKSKEVTSIEDDVLTGLKQWPSIAEGAGVPESNMQIIEKVIQSRINTFV